MSGRLGIALVALAAACVVLAAPALAQTGANRAAAPIGLEPLGEQSLAPGRCGLFLWSRSAERRDRDLIAIIGGEPASLYVRVNRQLTQVPQTGRSGGDAAQPPPGGLAVLPEQRFQGDTMSASVRLSLSPAPAGAAYPIIRGGVIVFRAPGGWETVTPVSGDVRCTPPRR